MIHTLILKSFVWSSAIPIFFTLFTSFNKLQFFSESKPYNTEGSGCGNQSYPQLKEH